MFPFDKDDANCKNISQKYFFPEHGKNTLTAKSICEECIVKEQCLQYSIDLEDMFPVHGIWGGTTREERLPLIRQQGKSQGRRYKI